MKLWLLERYDDAGWDEYKGFVIRAPSEEDARHMAGEISAGEGKTIWHDSTLSSCEELKPDGPSGVVLASFNAG